MKKTEILLAYLERIKQMLTSQQLKIIDRMLAENKPINATELAELIGHQNRTVINNTMHVLVGKKMIQISHNKDKFTYFEISDPVLKEIRSLMVKTAFILATRKL